MNESKKRFVEQLLAADPPPADARRHYEKEIRAMVEKTLTCNERRVHFVLAVLMGLMAVACGVMGCGWIFNRENTTVIPAFFLPMALALLVVASILMRGSWKGVVNRRTSNDWAAGAGIALASLVGCLFLMLSESWPEPLRDIVRVLGAVLLGYAAVAWMRQRIAQAEGRAAEKLLEIELRLAEIGEVLQNRPKPANPASPHPPPRESL